MKKIWMIMLCFFTGLLYAEEKDLSTVFVTATRIQQNIHDINRSIDVILKESLTLKSSRNISEALKNTTGIIVQGNADINGEIRLSIRGAGGTRTLLMMDGFNQNSISVGYADLSQYESEIVERIEIVRGGVSHIYGANAIGGVINIITKSPPEEVGKYTLRLKSSYGTYNTWKIYSEHSYRISNMLGYFIGISRKATEGYRDNMDYQSNNLFVKLGIYPTNKQKLFVSFRDFKDEFGAPAQQPQTSGCPYRAVTTPQDRQLDRAHQFTGDYTFNITDKLTLRLKAQHEKSLLSWRQVAWGGDLTDHYKFRGNVKGYIIYQYEAHQFSIGTEYLREEYVHLSNSASGDYDATQISSGYWLQDIWKLTEKLSINAGVRFDHYPEYVRTTWNGGYLYKLDSDFSLRGSIQTVFRKPTLTDLYWGDDGWMKGNPSLSPEKGYSWDIGINKVFSSYSVRLDSTFFFWRLTDSIVWIQDPSDLNAFGFPYWKPYNVGMDKRYGIENFVSWEAIPDNLTLKLSYTYQQSIRERQTTGYEKNILPDHVIKSSIEYIPFKKIKTRIDTRFFSSYRYSNGADPAPSYSVTDLICEYEIYTHTKAYLTIRNLFDKDYAQIYSGGRYPMPHRTVEVAMELSW